MSQTAILLLANASLLGFRHGIDWDHIAAITDIVGTTTMGADPQRSQKRALALSALYASGHAMVVVVLGLGALCCGAILPQWVDPLMERIVGITLIILGAWVFYALARYIRGEESFVLQSRWMLLFAALRQLRNRFSGKISEQKSQATSVDQYGARTAFGVGMIHGIGAETGTQVLLIAAIGGAASHGLGVGILFAFVFGLFASNSLIAFLSSTGFISSARLRPLYLSVAVVAGCFSLMVGLFFACGQPQQLLESQNLFH